MQRNYTEEQADTGKKIREMAALSPYGWKAFYKSKEWERKRREILKRDRNACQECRKKGRYARANTVHHIIHLKDAPELALDPNNLESVCRECHELIHQDEKQQKNFWTPEKW